MKRKGRHIYLERTEWRYKRCLNTCVFEIKGLACNIKVDISGHEEDQRWDQASPGAGTRAEGAGAWDGETAAESHRRPGQGGRCIDWRHSNNDW